MIHILYIYSEITIKGGTDKVLTEKANYLATHGYRVTIITESQMGRPLSFELAPEVHHVDMGLDFNKQYTQNSFSRFFTYVSLMSQYKKQLKKILEELHPDITITTMGRSLSLLSKMHDGSIKIGEAHTTRLHLRSLHLMEQRGVFFRWIAKYMRWKMYRCASNLSVLVLLTQQDAEDWSGVTKTTVIPNPLSFYPADAARLDNKQAIMVGRYNDAKGYDYIIPAWEIVHRRYPSWQLHVYGSGELHDDILRWIHERHLEHAIILHEPIDNIQEKYLESSICVLSSRYEGFSLVIIEAMACGVPCVSFDCPYGPRTIIKNEVDGLLVDYLNVAALASDICSLIDNPLYRKKLGGNARKNILRFSKENVMIMWENLFEELISCK